MRFRSTMPLALGLLVAACATEADQAAQEATETATQEYASPADAVAELEANYEQHYNAGNASVVAEMHTDDAIVQNSTAAVLMGTEAIAAGMEEFMTAMSPTLDVMPAEQLMVGEWVIDRGSYANVVTPEGGEAVTLTGNYITLSRRTEDGLKIHRLTVNSDGPLPIPMPAPERMEFEPLADGPLADVAAAYKEHYDAGDAAMVAALYTDDAVAMFAERPLASGRAAIEQTVAEFMAQFSPQLTIMDAETAMLGDGWAVDRGAFVIEATMEGQSVTRHGTYMNLVRQADDGSWKIHWGISNFEPVPTM